MDIHEQSQQATETMPAKRGRPKCFKEEHALQQAMLLFWKYGYESTSIGQLTEAMGITAPSLYRSFGDKASLFQKCLDYYREHECCELEKVLDQAKTIKEGFRQYMQQAAAYLVQSHKPHGCMLTLSAINCSSENQHIQQDLTEQRQKKKAVFLTYLKKAQDRGELSIHTDPDALALFLINVFLGLSLQARDGATYEQLEQVIDQALKIWPDAHQRTGTNV